MSASQPALSVWDIVSSPLFVCILGGLGSLISALMLALWKMQLARIVSIEKKLDDLQLEIPKSYIPKSEARDLRQDILEVLHRVEDHISDRVREMEQTQTSINQQLARLSAVQSSCPHCGKSCDHP